MSSSILQGHLREAAILTRAVENVLRKLIRLLMGRISLTRLQEMIRLIFVQEAEDFLKREKPGRNVSLTKLALLTGLDTRTLGKIKEDSFSSDSISESPEFLKGFVPAFKVLDVWINDERFSDPISGKPADLPLSGGPNSFESLVDQAVTARGITFTSILERLLENGIVRQDPDSQSVELVSDSKIVFIGNDELDMLDIGLTSIGQLISTVHKNVKHVKDVENRYFQRGCWTYKLDPKNAAKLRANVQRFLSQVNENAKDIIEPYEETESNPDQLMAGIGMFYFQEDGSAN